MMRLVARVRLRRIEVQTGISGELIGDEAFIRALVEQAVVTEMRGVLDRLDETGVLSIEPFSFESIETYYLDEEDNE